MNAEYSVAFYLVSGTFVFGGFLYILWYTRRHDRLNGKK